MRAWVARPLSSQARFQSAQFKTTAHRVQRHMCLKNAKWTAISAVAILIGLTILILIILSACGVFDHKK